MNKSSHPAYDKNTMKQLVKIRGMHIDTRSVLREYVVRWKEGSSLCIITYWGIASINNTMRTLWRTPQYFTRRKYTQYIFPLNLSLSGYTLFFSFFANYHIFSLNFSTPIPHISLSEFLIRCRFVKHSVKVPSVSP